MSLYCVGVLGSGAIFKGDINSTLLLKQLEIKSYGTVSSLSWLDSFHEKGQVAAMRASSGLFKWLIKETEVPS